MSVATENEEIRNMTSGKTNLCLCLNIFDIDFRLKIEDWQESQPEEDFNARWTYDVLALKGKYIDYSLIGAELLMSDEVSYLRDMLGALLEGKLKKDCSFRFAEPDISFKLSTAKRLYDQPGRVVYRNGYMDVDIYMEMVVHFWCEGGLGANTFSMTFNRGEIMAMYIYLLAVTETIGSDDQRVLHYLKQGVFLAE